MGTAGGRTNAACIRPDEEHAACTATWPEVSP
jgi:hypothetical protein